jgi:hypothetical protein
LGGILYKLSLILANPSSPGKNMGSVNIELWILPQNEAD